ncbi:hypothetical protein ACF3OH_12605 [Chryseomicrobium aureum]|uniref:hypothetical protein n=1 Tax=Chryseomicrobium aureum TaxID=1441723 RepID=UPI00370D92AD
MKGKLAYSVLLIGLIVFSTTMIISNLNLKESERNLEVIMGNSLYHVWEPLNEVSESEGQEFSIDAFRLMNEKFESSLIYSDIVDKSVGSEVLTPVMLKLSQIGNEIENRYIQNGRFTKSDHVLYESYLEQIHNTLGALYDVYYLSGSEGQANIKASNFNKLIEIDENLEQIQLNS